MIDRTLVSRAFFAGVVVCVGFWSSDLRAQSVDDMSAYMGYRGYSTYRQNNDEAPRGQMPHHYGAPVPITDKYLYDPDRRTAGQQVQVYMESDMPSRVEQFYRNRTGDNNLSQFGYDLFYTDGFDHHDNEKTMPAGAVQNDYIVQSGDDIAVMFSGERRDREVYTITSNGRLLIRDLPPVMAMGRPLSEVREEVNHALDQIRYRGNVDISVAAIRQIGVLIAGHVQKPGRHNLNAYYSVLDALNLAGGVKKSGSLRNIKLIRNGSTQYIDLYNFITFNNYGSDITLKDGDRLIIPPLGSTVAVTGDVKQTGIFELRTLHTQAQSITLNEALAMAGGPLGRGDHRFALRQGGGEVINLGRTSGAVIHDGAVLDVMRSTDRLDNAIEVKGHTRRNGVYDLDSAGTLRQLIGDGQILADDTYPLMGVIARIERDSLIRKLMGFSPQMIAKGDDDRQLEEGDDIYLFSNQDIHEIISNNKDKNDYPKQIVDFVNDHLIRISGAVRAEGGWPVGVATDMQTLISVAGGLTSKASLNDIEITSRLDGGKHARRTVDGENMVLSSLMLEAGDQVRVNERYEQAVEKTVRITGEIKNPGNYDLMRGDTLLSLIDRAGGITPDAYPPAAVFSRKSERKREEQKFRAAAQELERTVSVNMNAQDKGASLTPAQISMARKLADDLRAVQAIGRVMVEADPAVLSVKPEVNMLLEDGDHLHIPKRSLNVRVSGEVMNPTSLLFDQDYDADDYIRQAGGTSYYADKGRSFVIYPDGSAQPLERSSWSATGKDMIIPGSTIIIPRDPKPFNFMDSFKDITQILSNMAITGVFIEDIANDEN